MASTTAMMLELVAEQQLVDQARSGDAAAFEELYRRHADVAWRLAVAVARSTDDAGPAVAEGFATTFALLRSGRELGAGFQTAVLSAVRNAAADRDRLGHALTVDGSAPPVLPAPWARTSGDERRVADTFASLPERWRTVLWLTEVEALTPPAAGAVVAMAPAAAVQLLGRARRGLREGYLHAARTDADPGCRRSLERLGAHAAGTLPARDAEIIGAHLTTCLACARRFAGLVNVSSLLRPLTVPRPTLLVDDVRRAWVASVTPTVRSTATGLSPTTEKVVAGVAAAAAAIGIFGAALTGLTNGRGRGDEIVAPPAATGARAADTTPAPVLIDSVGATVADAVDAAVARRNSDAASTGGRGRAGLVALAPGGTAGGDSTGGLGGNGGHGATKPPTGGGGGAAPPPASTTKSVASVSAGTTVGDVPIAATIDVGGNGTGVTVGPVTVGATQDPPAADDPPVSVGGSALGDVQQVLEPIVDDVTTLLGG